MGFILPPLIYQSIVGWKNLGASGKLAAAGRLAIVFLGVALLISSTAFTISDLVHPAAKNATDPNCGNGTSPGNGTAPGNHSNYTLLHHHQLYHQFA